MSQEFKLRFDQMRESNLSKTDETFVSDGKNGLYHGSSHARNLCLVWPDGRRYFLNYSYLIGAELIVGEDMNQINLNFSSHTAILQGYSLEPLFMELLDHLPKLLSAVYPRYAQNRGHNNSIVVSMVVEANAS